MPTIISAGIDLNKIDKSKIRTTDKDGNPFNNGAKYLDVEIFLNETKDKYGNDVSIAIKQTKEDRKSTRLNSSHVSESRMPSSA